MQPYFLPYLGYFQLINAVDVFVVYDNVEFSRKGWFHRNRLLFDGQVEMFTINLVKDSDYLDVVDRRVSDVYMERDRHKILRKVKQYYRRAPHFDEVFPFLESVFMFDSTNLFQYIHNAIVETCRFLQIKTKILVSSTLSVDHSLRNKYRIFEIAKFMNVAHYVNPIGGQTLYNVEDFASHGVKLSFLRPHLRPYPQVGDGEFVPSLSIIDVIMNLDLSEVQARINEYELV